MQEKLEIILTPLCKSEIIFRCHVDVQCEALRVRKCWDTYANMLVALGIFDASTVL